MSSSKPDYVFSFLWHLIFKSFLVVVVEVGSRLGIILSIGLGSFLKIFDYGLWEFLPYDTERDPNTGDEMKLTTALLNV